jgi:hypothetical protein
MALQLFVGPWPLQFCSLSYADSRTPWTSDKPVTRPLLTHGNTNTLTDIHALSGIRTHNPNFRGSEETVHAVDRAGTVIGVWR